MVKRQLDNIKIFLILWGLFLLCLMVCFSAFTISKIKNENAITKAQVENIGKPIEYHQYYHSPNENNNSN